jgi:hypothetical protein
MKKLKLSLESLHVESFEIIAPRTARGTVQGHDATQLADTCNCYRPSDGCTIGCWNTGDCGDPSWDDCGSADSCGQNNCGTIIVE